MRRLGRETSRTAGGRGLSVASTVEEESSVSAMGEDGGGVRELVGSNGDEGGSLTRCRLLGRGLSSSLSIVVREHEAR